MLELLAATWVERKRMVKPLGISAFGSLFTVAEKTLRGLGSVRYGMGEFVGGDFPT